jgi:hypothetical protein
VDLGCEFRFRLFFPSAAPDIFFEEHAEHLAVEFRGFVRTASNSIHGKNQGRREDYSE